MGGGPDDLDRLPKMSSCAEFDNVAMSDCRVIRMSRVRFTIGDMMIAVAILALWMIQASSMGPATWLTWVIIGSYQAVVYGSQAERLGGTLRLRVVRPWLKQLQTVTFVLYAVVFMASLGYFVIKMRATTAGSPASILLTAAFDTWLPCACIGILLYWQCLLWTRLEFRERGVVDESTFWPWDSIRKWGWKDGGYTLTLKDPDRTMWYKVGQADKESVQAILVQRLGLVKHLS